MQVEVKGLDQLGKALRALPSVLAKRYLRHATFAAADVIKEEAIALAPVRTGALRDHIATFRRSSDPNTAHYAVGVRRIKFNRKEKTVLRLLRKAQHVKRIAIEGDVYYWRFLEFGTSKMAPRPFLRPAFEGKKDQALDTFRNDLSDNLSAAAAEARG